MRRAAIITSILAIWVFTPGSAFAFQQTPTASGPPVAPSQAQEGGASLNAESANPPAGVVGETGSKGFGIPGLGSIGILPKLDFGLELLYGTSAEERAEESAVPDTGFDDVTIRGSVKRRF